MTILVSAVLFYTSHELPPDAGVQNQTIWNVRPIFSTAVHIALS